MPTSPMKQSRSQAHGEWHGNHVTDEAMSWTGWTLVGEVDLRGQAWLTRGSRLRQ
jgi:hypothetical protein